MEDPQPESNALHFSRANGERLKFVARMRGPALTVEGVEVAPS
jgi:hypothetical protein